MNKMLINKPSCRQACFFVTEKKNENENSQQKEPDWILVSISIALGIVEIK
jgi:hypothetical protein